MAGLRRWKKNSRASRYQRPGFVARAGNESGIALVIAMVMLALLGILGTWALDTSSTELKIAGNYRTTQYAFLAGDAGVGYVTNANTLTAVYNTGQGWIERNVEVDLSTKSSFTASVPSILEGPLPLTGSPATIYDADIGSGGYHGVYTAVTSTGTAMNNSVVVIEVVVSQAVPN